MHYESISICDQKHVDLVRLKHQKAFKMIKRERILRSP